MMTVEMCPTPCVLCGKRLINFNQSPRNHPLGGLEFTTRGHYGSTLFDPGDGSTLIINICDPCVETLAVKRGVLKCTSSRSRNSESEPEPRIWDNPEQD